MAQMTQTAPNQAASMIENEVPARAHSASLVDWILANRKRLLALLVVLLLALASLAVVQSRQSAAAARASEAFYEATRAEAGSDAAVAAYQKVAQSWPGTHAAWDALMALGDLEAKKDPKGAKASEWFEKADAQASDARDKLIARYSAAYSREAEGKLELALAHVESAQRLGLPHLKGELALARARLLDRLGKKDEAVQAYDAILKDFAGTETARTAEGWKAAR